MELISVSYVILKIGGSTNVMIQRVIQTSKSAFSSPYNVPSRSHSHLKRDSLRPSQSPLRSQLPITLLVWTFQQGNIGSLSDFGLSSLAN